MKSTVAMAAAAIPMKIGMGGNDQSILGNDAVNVIFGLAGDDIIRDDLAESAFFALFYSGYFSIYAGTAVVICYFIRRNLTRERITSTPSLQLHNYMLQSQCGSGSSSLSAMGVYGWYVTNIKCSK